MSSSKVIPLLNAILHELQKNVVDVDDPESQDTSAPIVSEECQQVIIGTRWTDYENDDIYYISTLLDPQFKFSALALDRAKKLLLVLMRRVNAAHSDNCTDNAMCVIQ